MLLGLCIFSVCGQSKWVWEKDFFFLSVFLSYASRHSTSLQATAVTEQNGLPSCEPKDLTCHYTFQSTPLAIIRGLSTHSHVILSWWIIACFASWFSSQIEFWLQKQTKSFLTRLSHCFITGFWTSGFALCVCPLCKNKLCWLVSQ